MAVLIDPPMWPWRGRLWSHLVSDSSLEELHAFAAGIAVPARAFEGDHYDVPAERYAEVLRAGAQAVDARELLGRLRQSGLRRPKRRGERVLASVLRDDGSRRDVLLSGLSPPAAATALSVLALSAGSLLVHRSPRRWHLPRVQLPSRDDAGTARAALTGCACGQTGEEALSSPWRSNGAWSRLGYLRTAGASGPPTEHEAVWAVRLPAPAAVRVGGRYALVPVEEARGCGQEWVPLLEHVEVDG